MSRLMCHQLACPVFFLLLLLVCTTATAHPMPAQRGTLNFVDDGAFLVISVPTSAFAGIDDDQDGRLSPDEFNRHRATIAAAVVDGVRLTDAAGPCALEGLMLSPAAAHDTSTEPSTQLIVLGRFALNRPEGEISLSFDLFGESTDEQELKFSARRSSNQQRITFRFTPEQRAMTFLAISDS